MKKKIYFTFFIITFLITIFIYQKTIKNQSSEVDKIIEENSLTENSNNLIKNLKYNVNFENNSSYSITAGESELIDENNIEIIITEIDLDYYNQVYYENFGETQNDFEAIKNIVVIKKFIDNFKKNNHLFLKKIDDILNEPSSGYSYQEGKAFGDLKASADSQRVPSNQVFNNNNNTIITCADGYSSAQSSGPLLTCGDDGLCPKFSLLSNNLPI